MLPPVTLAPQRRPHDRHVDAGRQPGSGHEAGDVPRDDDGRQPGHRAHDGPTGERPADRAGDRPCGHAEAVECSQVGREHHHRHGDHVARGHGRDAPEVGGGDQEGDEGRQPDEVEAERGVRPPRRHEEVVGQLDGDAGAAQDGEQGERGGGVDPAVAVDDAHERAAQHAEEHAGRHDRQEEQAQRPAEALLVTHRVVLEHGERRQADGAHRGRERSDRPPRQVEGEHVDAQPLGPEDVAHDRVVEVHHGEDHDARPGQRKPEAEQGPSERGVPPRAVADRDDGERADGQHHGAGHPRPGEAPGPEPGRRQRQRHRGGHGEGGEVGHQLAVLAELALQAGRRRRRQPGDEQRHGQQPDRARGRGRTERAGQPGGGQRHQCAEDRPRQHRHAGHDRGDAVDLGAVTGLDDGDADPELAHADHDVQHDQGRGVHTELLGDDQAGERDAHDHLADAAHDRVDRAPGQPAAHPGPQGGRAGGRRPLERRRGIDHRRLHCVRSPAASNAGCRPRCGRGGRPR